MNTQKKTAIGVVVISLILLFAAGVVVLTRQEDSNMPIVLPQQPVSDQVEQAPEDVSSEEVAPSTATYKLTLNIAWSSQSHGAGYPAGAHTSPAVVLAHTEPGQLFSVGQVVSDGIEQVAETGATSLIATELKDVIAYEGAFAVGERVDAPGAAAPLIITVQEATPLLSVLSMLAPSPDWLIGVADAVLFDEESEEWVDTLTIDLAAYDAGTDNGADFTSQDIDTSPRVTLGIPIDPVFKQAVNTTFGTLTVERQSE